MISSSTDFISKRANRKVRKLLGRAYLRENRIHEALEVYLGILKDYPDDGDVLVIMGNLYRLSGNLTTARRLYRQAMETNPQDSLAEKQLQAAKAQTCCDWEVSDPLSDEAIAMLANRLQVRTALEQVEEIRASADIPDRAAQEEQSVEHNGNNSSGSSSGKQGQLPEDIQQLMPALIAQNIRQARAAGFIELAEVLQSLQINLARQVEDHWADDLLKDEPPLEKRQDE